MFRGVENGITLAEVYAIYDALLAKCALKANATIIYTWDLDYFRLLGPEVARRIRTP